MAPGSK
jgi:hypothetical protein